MAKYFAILVSIIIVTACGSSTTTTNCLNEQTKHMKIRWGGVNLTTGYTSSWQIDSSLVVSSMLKTNKKEDYRIEKIQNIDADRYCRMLLLAQKYFYEIQALNAPGDSSHFVQITNEKTGVNLRAMWNVRFKTYGSREFRALYDSLSRFIEPKENVMKKEGRTPSNSVN